MDIDRFKAMMIAPLMDGKQALYLQSGNPIHAWSAYHAARTAGIAIPAWVLDCFDVWAAVLTATTYTKAKDIAHALKISNKNGSRLAVQQAKTATRDLEILDDIQHLEARPTRSELKAMRKAHGLTGDIVDPGDRNITEIMDQVAGQHGVEYSTVNAINAQEDSPDEASRQALVENLGGSLVNTFAALSMMPFMDAQTATSASTLDTAREPRRAGSTRARTWSRPNTFSSSSASAPSPRGGSVGRARFPPRSGSPLAASPGCAAISKIGWRRRREVMMTRPAKVVAIEALGAGPTHEVIHDPVARMLADLFLPPDGTQISGDDLQACVARLVDATNAMKQLDQREAQ